MSGFPCSHAPKLIGSSDEDDKTWVWKSEEADLWFDPGTVVNVRIEQEHWQDQAPGARTASGDVTLESQPHVPYSLTVSNFFLRHLRVLTLHWLPLLKEALVAWIGGDSGFGPEPKGLARASLMLAVKGIQALCTPYSSWSIPRQVICRQ